MPYLRLRGSEHYYQWIPEPPTDDRPKMVFLHGWGGSGRYWQETARSLADCYDCFIYDLRGFGRSRLISEEPSDYELETYADDLAALLDKLNLDRVSLQAHSTGASIAVLFANRYPQRVDKLILCCSGIFEYDERTFSNFHKASNWVVKLRPSWLSAIPGMDRLFMARFLHRPIPSVERRAFLEDYIMADGEAALGTVYTAVSEKAATTMPTEFANLTVPTLLVAGEKDIIIPAEMGRKAANLSDRVEYVCIPYTAHFPMLEDAAAYRDRVRSFLGI